MVGPFSIFLWVGGVLSFIAYALDRHAVDNISFFSHFLYFLLLKMLDFTLMYIGIVLVSIILITGTFSYWQERKSSDAMKKFANLLPAQAMVSECVLFRCRSHSIQSSLGKT